MKKKTKRRNNILYETRCLDIADMKVVLEKERERERKREKEKKEGERRKG